ncbi:lysozyme inhibitor LprI family protein [Burkholderia gladioli]|uniref:lysozyme inhibitor LprI family protein n=1 Tax=Burkholderia gladioli TaxID=28095 RepID=UPI000F811834|nr:lysozyme inhibitor LprI family protein [Burkholderia gladioli]
MKALMKQKAFLHLVFVGLSLCLSAGVYAAGPSFNCTKAKSAAEKAICVHPGLAALDVKIAQEYRALRAKLDPPAAASLAEDQRWFVDTRDAIAEAPRRMSPSDLGAFLNNRVRFLGAIDPHPPEGFVGSWRNVAGGFDIEIKADGTLSITGNAAQPANGNWVCEYQGTGKAASGNMLEPTTDEMDANASRLRLSREGALLKVKTVVAPGSDSNTFCGMNGSFDGTYFAVPRGYNSSTSHSS